MGGSAEAGRPTLPFWRSAAPPPWRRRRRRPRAAGLVPELLRVSPASAAARLRVDARPVVVEVRSGRGGGVRVAGGRSVAQATDLGREVRGVLPRPLFVQRPRSSSSELVDPVVRQRHSGGKKLSRSVVGALGVCFLLRLRRWRVRVVELPEVEDGEALRCCSSYPSFFSACNRPCIVPLV